MPMPMAAPSNTARKRASVASSALPRPRCARRARRGSDGSCSAGCVRAAPGRTRPRGRAGAGRSGPGTRRRAAVRTAVEHQVGVDDPRVRSARRGRCSGAATSAAPTGRRARVEVPGVQRLAQDAGQRRRCVSNSGRVSEVAVDGKIARLQMVAKRLSLSSGPSGSARCRRPGRPAHAFSPTPAKPVQHPGRPPGGAVGPPERQRHQAGFDHPKPSKKRAELWRWCA